MYGSRIVRGNCPSFGVVEECWLCTSLVVRLELSAQDALCRATTDSADDVPSPTFGWNLVIGRELLTARGVAFGKLWGPTLKGS